MSKRKPETRSKHAPRPKTAKAKRAKKAVGRSPEDSGPGVGAAGSAESPPERHNESHQEAPLVENSAPALQSTALQSTALQSTALQEDCKQTMTDNDAKRGFDFSSATENVRAYQATLLKLAQADIEFAFEFTQRLATIRSPVEFPPVIAEFTGKRFVMFMDAFKRNG